jgi:hypothetical protein
VVAVNAHPREEHTLEIKGDVVLHTEGANKPTPVAGKAIPVPPKIRGEVHRSGTALCKIEVDVFLQSLCRIGDFEVRTTAGARVFFLLLVFHLKKKDTIRK